MAQSNGANSSSLVSRLMQEMNDGNQEPQTPMQMQVQYSAKPQEEYTSSSFNPQNEIPPPRPDDIAQEDEYEDYENYAFNESDGTNESDSDDEDYENQRFAEIFEHIGGEYTRSFMELIKSSMVILLGYVIFSHPLVNNFIMQYISMVPFLQNIVTVPTYYLALKGLLLVGFYLIVTSVL